MVALTLRRRAGELALEAVRDGVRDGTSGAPLHVDFSPALPLGATGVTASVDDGVATPVTVVPRPGAVVVSGTPRPLAGRVTLRVRWTGGWEVDPPRPAPRTGDRSRALRVVSERMDGARYVVRLEGLAGATYTMRLRGPESAASLRASVGSGRMAPAPAADGWRDVTVSFPPEGGNDDGFVAMSLSFTGR